MDAGAIGFVVNLFVQLFGLTTEAEPSGVAASSCPSPPAYEQSARPGERAPAAQTECGNATKGGEEG